jgi:hypothetical protein
VPGGAKESIMAVSRRRQVHGSTGEWGIPEIERSARQSKSPESTLPSVKRRQHPIMQIHVARPAHFMTRMIGLGGSVSSGPIEIGLKLRARPVDLFPAALFSEGLHHGAIRAV